MKKAAGSGEKEKGGLEDELNEDGNLDDKGESEIGEENYDHLDIDDFKDKK